MPCRDSYAGQEFPGWQIPVAFANQHNLGLAVQSTGHGNVRSADDCLLILTREMNGVAIDPAAQRTTIDAGMKWGAVLAAAQEQLSQLKAKVDPDNLLSYSFNIPLAS